MPVVTQLATGETEDLAEGDPKLAYYRGEANTVGGYSIDGVDYPAKVDESAGEPVEQLPPGEVAKPTVPVQVSGGSPLDLGDDLDDRPLPN